MTDSIVQRTALAGCLAVLAIGAPIVTAADPATLIITNAKVWTGDDDVPEASAVAIGGNRILAVGDDEDVLAFRGDTTRMVDAQGRRIIPGLTDSHTHIIGFGLQLTRLDLRSAGGKVEFIERVNAAAATAPLAGWILGGQYTVESWAEPESPRKEWIDDVTSGHPLFLNRTDGHQALANSMALKIAGIDRDGPPDPPGGVIERDPDTNEPTGILKDDAMLLVSKHIPETSKRDMYDAFKNATRVLNAWGITSIHDMSELRHVIIFNEARKHNALTVRVRSYVESTNFPDTWAKIESMEIENDDWFQIAGFKAFMDGSLGSRTAYMREPYLDAKPTDKYPRGLRSGHATDLDAFGKQIVWADGRGLQMAVHAIGDQAIHELLDIYASLPGARDRRYRVEHTQHLLPQDIRRFATLNVVASMQPYHKADDGRWAEAILGPQRSMTTYAFRSLLEAGAKVCFGSDVPVAPANPFAGIAAANSARTLDGKVWVVQQSIRSKDALTAYATTPAWAAFREDRLGKIKPGYLADMAILSDDVLAASVDQLPNIESVMTIVDGKVVYVAGQGGG